MRQCLIDPGDEYFCRNASPEDIEAKYCKEVIVPEAARWEAIRTARTICKHIDDALGLIEAENPKRQCTRSYCTGVR